jgi:hypothetical protein
MVKGEYEMKAYELIEQNGWCQGEAARNDEGRYVATLSDSATQFCALGAIYRVYGNCQADKMYKEFAKAMNFLDTDYSSEIVRWNDTQGRTKEEVVEALRRADV